MQSLRALLKIPGAHKADMPGFIEPCLATTAAHVPLGKNWSQEIKLDGYRVQAHVSNGETTLFTRRGFNWAQRFPMIASELARVDVRTAIMDGEVYVADNTGRSDFHWLQADLAKGRADRLIYSTFDLLFIDGVDLRDATCRTPPCVARRHQRFESSPHLIQRGDRNPKRRLAKAGMRYEV